ncbi:MAG: hypothetical protein ACYSUK_01310 [Planctomycetota bacterium]|jgi:prepilin-type processing-associated H-X9-DG protein
MRNKAFTIVELLIIIILILLILYILMPRISRPPSVSPRMVCGSNLSALGKAMLVYANENDGKYPTPNKWCDLLLQHADISEKQLKCWSNKEARCTYAMNPNCTDWSSPPDMVLLFETKGGWNQYGGPELITAENHDLEGCNVLYCDAHVSFERSVDDLKWQIDPNDKGITR